MEVHEQAPRGVAHLGRFVEARRQGARHVPAGARGDGDGGRAGRHPGRRGHGQGRRLVGRAALVDQRRLLAAGEQSEQAQHDLHVEVEGLAVAGDLGAGQSPLERTGEREEGGQDAAQHTEDHGGILGRATITAGPSPEMGDFLTIGVCVVSAWSPR